MAAARDQGGASLGCGVAGCWCDHSRAQERMAAQRAAAVFSERDAMVVVAANSGLPTPPSWYLKLKAEPSATVDVEGRTPRVRAEELPDDEAAAFWPRVLEAAPDSARYPRWASRRIPPAPGAVS